MELMVGRTRRLGCGGLVALAATAALAAAQPVLASHGRGGGPNAPPPGRSAAHGNGFNPGANHQNSAGVPSESVRGVVQSLSATAVVLKQLDGSTVSVPVDRHTRVFVDGRPAELTDVKPGDVLVASWSAGRAASQLLFLSAG
jgi:hypothetical protein